MAVFENIDWILVMGCALAAMFAGISKGGFGSAVAFAPSAVLALVLPPAQAIGIMLPILLLVDAVTLRPYWGRWSTKDAIVLTLGGLPGVVIGAWIFTVISSDMLRVFIGAIAVVFVIWQGVRRSFAHGWRMPRWAGVIAGGVAGVSSFISHAGGPPAAVYLLSRHLDKTTFQSTTVVVFGVINIGKFIPYAFLGMFTWETLTIDALIAPFALLGAWLGVRAHFRMPEKVFFGITYLCLAITGAKLIVDGLGY